MARLSVDKDRREQFPQNHFIFRKAQSLLNVLEPGNVTIFDSFHFCKAHEPHDSDSAPPMVPARSGSGIFPPEARGYMVLQASYTYLCNENIHLVGASLIPVAC